MAQSIDTNILEFLQQLESQDRQVRIYAWQGVKKLDAEAVSPHFAKIFAAFGNEPADAVIRYAGDTLGKLAHSAEDKEKTLSVLIALFNDSWDRRKGAWRGLRQLGVQVVAPKFPEILYAFEKEDDPLVLMDAKYAIKMFTPAQERRRVVSTLARAVVQEYTVSCDDTRRDDFSVSRDEGITWFVNDVAKDIAYEEFFKEGMVADILAPVVEMRDGTDDAQPGANALVWKLFHSGISTIDHHKIDDKHIRKTTMMLLRFFLAAGLVLGPCELALRWLSDGDSPHVAINSSTMIAVFLPLGGDHCKLPPPQPFWLVLALNAAKMALVGIALGTAPDFRFADPEASKTCADRMLFSAMAGYQWVMVPVTMLSTIGHFASAMGPFESIWQGYQCFGVLWSLGPWAFNALMLGTSWFTKQVVLQRAGQWKSINDDALNTFRIAELRDTLLPQERSSTAVDLETRKAKAAFKAAVATAVPFLVIWFPFLITHIIPAAVMYAPEVAFIAALLLVVYKSIGGSFFLFKSAPTFAECGYNSDDFDEKLHRFRQAKDNIIGEVEKSAGLTFLPLLFLATLLIEALALQATYFYDGEGYLGAMYAALTERRADAYFASFKAKILGQFWATADILNEAI